MNAKEFIEETISKNNIVLFMKGTAQSPQCGFSSNVVETLKKIGVNNLATVNVLDDSQSSESVTVTVYDPAGKLVKSSTGGLLLVQKYV